MYVGDRVCHVSRPELGQGRISRIYDDGHCDVVFERSTFTWIPLSGVVSIERQVELGSLDEMLARGEFEEAKVQYRNRCQKYLDESGFQLRLANAIEAERLQKRIREEARIAAERQALRDAVEVSLDDGRFGDADNLYHQSCSTWWHSSDYESVRAKALFVSEYADCYVSGSMASLDRICDSSAVGTSLSTSERIDLKLEKLKFSSARMGQKLDSEQMAACACPSRFQLIRARAGAGKTRTLAAIAGLVINDEQLNPDQLLILAFNKKAANEIGDRVRDLAGISEYRNARTFHSLAYKLADHGGKSLVFDDGDLQPSRRKQSQFVERVIRLIVIPAFRDRLYEFFRRELEQIDRIGSNLPESEYFAFRRAMSEFSLGGDNVKSSGEKFIADFLFEHGINYVYERVFSWDKKDRLSGSPYRPDFCLTVGGRDLILEHWAIDPKDATATVPDWWAQTSTNEYRRQIDEKQRYWLERGICLLETHTGMLRGGRAAFESQLRCLLEAEGIVCQKLEAEVLKQRVAEAPRTISRMAGLFLAFVSRAKKRGWNVAETERELAANPDPEPRNRIFHQLAVRAYGEYESLLAAESAMDFDDLLQLAAERVRKDGSAATIGLGHGDEISIRDLRWILIDEFQDFSELYFNLIQEILQVNPMIRVVAVGDDWQAINAFAGAQLKFFNEFDRCFQGAGVSEIATNYRSGQAIVGAGNRVMEGRGSPARAGRDWVGHIECQAVDKIWVGNQPLDVLCHKAVEDPVTGKLSGSALVAAKALKACVEFIIGSRFRHEEKHFLRNVLVLARTGTAYGMTLKDFQKALFGILEVHPDLRELANEIQLEVMTVHRAKGKEADTVIVLEAIDSQFPKVHADNQLFAPFGVSIEDTLAEERRLFYVAITRAEHRLLVLTESNRESPFVGELHLNKGMSHLGALGQPRAGTLTTVPLGPIAKTIRQRIDRIDPATFIRHNITPAAIPEFDRLMAKGLGVPEIPYFLKGELCAELAWPQAKPPVAILSGRHVVDADEWESAGWEVHRVK